MQATRAGNGHPLPSKDCDSFASECNRRVHFLKEYVPTDVLGGKYHNPAIIVVSLETSWTGFILTPEALAEGGSMERVVFRS